MKRIEGRYEKHLREFEDIENYISDYDVEHGFYFTKYNYPNNFVVNLYYYNKNLIPEFDEYGFDKNDIIKICAFDAKQNYSNKDLLKFIDEELEKMKIKNEISLQLDKKLEELVKENKDTTMASLRKKVLQNFKSEGTILNYTSLSDNETNSNNVLFWGTLAKGDETFKVIL